jgi:hypothetical protein
MTPLIKRSITNSPTAPVANPAQKRSMCMKVSSQNYERPGHNRPAFFVRLYHTHETLLLWDLFLALSYECPDHRFGFVVLEEAFQGIQELLWAFHHNGFRCRHESNICRIHFNGIAKFKK